VVNLVTHFGGFFVGYTVGIASRYSTRKLYNEDP
jgi:hypothetical protein